MAQPQAYYPPSQPAKSDTAIILVIVIIAVIVLAVIGGVIAFVFFGAVRTSTIPTTSTHTYQSSNIVHALITVQAGSYNSYYFTVPPTATGITVSGSFTTSGGSGNDIQVLVVDQTNYVNWQNHHQVYTYYDSGQATTGTINASLPSTGTYYLVYSNTFSTLSSKNVDTTANVAYNT